MTWRLTRFIVIVGLLLGAAPSGLRAQGSRPGLGFELGYSRASFAPGGLTGPGRKSDRRLHQPANQRTAQRPDRAPVYDQSGALTAGTPVGPAPAAVQTVYVEIPLLARVVLPLGRRVSPVLLGGGSYALSVGCEFQADVPGAFAQTRCDQPGTGLQLVKSDMSAIVGAASSTAGEARQCGSSFVGSSDCATWYRKRR